MKSLLFLTLLFLTNLLLGQVLRVDHKALGSDTIIGWQGKFEIDFLLNNLQSTAEEEVNYIGFRGITDVAYLGKKNEYYLKNELRYYKADGSEFLNRGYSYIRVNWLRAKQLQPETIGQLQFDNIRNLNFRALAVQGIKYIPLYNESHEINVGTGLMYEHERWTDFSNEDQVVAKNLMKSSSYLGLYSTLNDRLTLSLLAYYQVGYDRQDDLFRHRINSSFEVNNHLTKKIEWIVRFQFQYESAPIIPVAPFVYELTNGLRFKFG